MINRAHQNACVYPSSPPRGLTSGQKIAVIIGSAAMALLLVCGGGTVLVAAFGESPGPAANGPAPTPDVNAPADPGPTTAPAPSTAPPTPTVEYTKKTVVEEERIAFGVTRVNDPNLAKGTTKVRRNGVNGLKRLTYEVTYADGVETERVLVREEVVKKPVAKVIAVGTKAPKCDPNYAWACVPIASDVDCAGGSGNGPAYVQGPVKVVGTDIYDLDRDGDGIGCD